MKQLFISKKESFLLLVIFACVATLVILPIFSNCHIPNVCDIINHFAGITQAKMANAEHQFFLRTAPSGHFSSFRYPFFQFYSPTSYTVAGFIYQWITPSSPFSAFKLTIWLSLILGGIYIYQLALWFFASRSSAILSALVYLTAPYLFIVVNDIAAFNEAIALGIFPCVLFYTLQCFYFPYKKINLLLTAFAWYLLATIHLISFIYFSLFLGIFLIALARDSLSRWKNLFLVGIAYSFGCVLAMWYLAPIVLYAKNLFIANQLFNTNAYDRYPVFLAYLFAPLSSFSHGIASPAGPNVIDKISQIHPAVGLPISFAFFISCYLFIKKIPVKKPFDDMVPALLLLFCIVFFAIWSPINFWQWLPSSFGLMQYTWRLLGQMIWIGALLFGWVMCWLFSNKMSLKSCFLIISLIILLSTSWLSTPQNGFRENLPYDTSYFVFQPNAYLMNYNKVGANAIDELSLNSLIKQWNGLNLLNINETAVVPSILLKTAYAPMLTLKGNYLTDKNQKASHLKFLLNGSTIATFLLKQKEFEWKIPLDVKNIKEPSTFMQFQLMNGEKNLSILIKNIYLSGFLNGQSTMFLHQLPKTACYQKNAETLCHVPVSKNIEWLELPIFYYENMLNITVNDKPVAYESILQGQYLITGIKPEQGMVNHIRIEFRGLLWANYISYMGWSLFFLLCVYFSLHKMLYGSKV